MNVCKSTKKAVRHARVLLRHTSDGLASGRRTAASHIQRVRYDLNLVRIVCRFTLSCVRVGPKSGAS
jgi:hypothetical protein